MYPIAELFHSIQGEGAHVGQPCTFIRLAGCNLTPPCPFCDTDHTKHMDMSLEALLNLEHSFYFRVVITGGEPCVHDLQPLVDALKDSHAVCIETNGTLPVPEGAWITCSPKGSSFQAGKVDEFKFLMTGAGWLVEPNPYIKECPRALKYVQPIFGSTIAMNNAIRQVQADPSWALSVQVHKLIGVR